MGVVVFRCCLFAVGCRLWFSTVGSAVAFSGAVLLRVCLQLQWTFVGGPDVCSSIPVGGLLFFCCCACASVLIGLPAGFHLS